MDRAHPDQRRLPIVAIESPAGSIPIPNELESWVELDPDSSLRVSDSVNVRSAAVTPVPGGLRLAQVVTTLVAHDRSDPTRAALIDAVAAIVKEGNTIAMRRAADTLTLVANGYRLTCSR